MRLELKMPRLGEAMTEGRVSAWMIGPGEDFADGDVLIEVETDKTLVDAPAPAAGRMLKHLAREGSDVPVGAPIAIIEVEAAAAARFARDAAPAPPPAAAKVGGGGFGSGGSGSVPAVGSQASARSRGKRPFKIVSSSPERPRAEPVVEQAAVAFDAMPSPLADPPSVAEPVGTEADPSEVAVDAKSGRAAAASQSLGPDQAFAALRSTFPGLGASPAARAAAQELKVPLSGLRGTGRRGRITALDVHAAAARGAAAATPSAKGGAPALHAAMLHGLFSDPSEMAPLGQALREAGALSAEAASLPAHGGASALADPSPAAAGAALAESLSDQKDLALVGHAFGAAVAVHAAGALGARIARLTLVCPIGLGAEIASPLLQAMLEARTPEAAARGAAALAGDSAPPLSPASAQDLAQRLNASRMALGAMLRAVAEGGVQQVWIVERLSRLPCPVTIVFGRDDPVVPVTHALAPPPNRAVRILPGVRHMPHLRAPCPPAPPALAQRP